MKCGIPLCWKNRQTCSVHLQRRRCGSRSPNWRHDDAPFQVTFSYDAFARSSITSYTWLVRFVRQARRIFFIPANAVHGTRPQAIMPRFRFRSLSLLVERTLLKSEVTFDKYGGGYIVGGIGTYSVNRGMNKQFMKGTILFVWPEEYRI